MKVLHVPVADFGNLVLLFLPCTVSVSALNVSSPQVHRRQTGAVKLL